MGSAPIAAAAAKTSSPVRQALISSTATFWDTVVVCAITGLVLVSSIMKNPAIDMAMAGDGGLLTTLAFAQIPIVGPGILVVGIITFAFSTILGWAYYGERCVEYLAGRRGLIFYRLLYILTAAAAPVIQLGVVWMTADVLNALMVLPNLISLLCLSNVVAGETQKYLNLICNQLIVIVIIFWYNNCIYKWEVDSMANSLVQFRANDDEKLEAIRICEKLGLNLPSYLRMCISRLVQENNEEIAKARK